MTNDLLTTLTADDGWGDTAIEAAQRVLRGTLLRFSDWNWTRGKEQEPVAKGTQLVVTGTAAAWVKWQGGKPVETLLRQPGTKMPEREDLDCIDQIEWEKDAAGKFKDPWANTRFVYLIDPTTAEAYTFSTSSWGGREAVINLGDSVARMRSAHPDAVPVVALEAAPMQTRYGRKSKPVLKITGWKAMGGGEVREIEHLPPTMRDDEASPEFPW
jgi:hypothetical protein